MKNFVHKIIEMNTIKLYVCTLVFHFLYSFVIGAILYLAGVSFSQHVASSSEFTSSLFLLPACALLEEMMFRWAPMMILFSGLAFLAKHVNLSDETYHRIQTVGIVSIVVVMSAIFGYVHGNLFNLLLQGVSSLIFYMFYLRTLYKQREKKDKLQLRPLLSSTIYHTLSNAILVAL